MDMDGVLVHEDRAIDGAGEFLRRLREAGTPFLVLTNNSTYTERDLAARLRAIGLDPITLQEELLTEVTGIAQRYMDRCDRSRIPCTSLWVPRSDEEFAEPSAI